MDDPLAHVFAPPLDESPRDKEHRIRAEQEAKKRSDAIDEEINKQRNARKSRPVKILLLGESTIWFRDLALRSLTSRRSKRIRYVLHTHIVSVSNSILPRSREVDNVEE